MMFISIFLTIFPFYINKIDKTSKINIRQYFAKIPTFCRKIVENYKFFTTFVRKLLTTVGCSRD